MDMSKFSGSSFLKAADIKASGPVRLKIDDVVEGQFGRPNLIFTDGSKLSLNATNNRTLMRAFGTDSDGWSGKEIVLMPGRTTFNGEPQDTILVTATSAAPENKASARPAFNKAQPKPDDDMDDSIPLNLGGESESGCALAAPSPPAFRS